MATTFTVTPVAPAKPGDAVGHHREVIVDIVATGTYTDGGDSLTPARFGFSKILLFTAELNQTVTTAGSGVGFLPLYDYANSKLKFYTAHGTPGATVGLIEATGATVTTATGVKFRARVSGI